MLLRRTVGRTPGESAGTIAVKGALIRCQRPKSGQTWIRARAASVSGLSAQNYGRFKAVHGVCLARFPTLFVVDESQAYAMCCPVMEAMMPGLPRVLLVLNSQCATFLKLCLFSVIRSDAFNLVFRAEDDRHALVQIGRLQIQNTFTARCGCATGLFNQERHWIGFI